MGHTTVRLNQSCGQLLLCLMCPVYICVCVCVCISINIYIYIYKYLSQYPALTATAVCGYEALPVLSAIVRAGKSSFTSNVCTSGED